MQIARRIALSSSKHFTHSKRVFNRIPDVVRGSNAYWHRRPFATSVAVDIPKVRKSPKKVSRDERKAMVESFINEYRSMNGGKFPSVSVTRNQVGGSYYVTKNIVQEVLRNSAGTKNEIVQEKKLEVDEASTNIEDVSESHVVIEKGICHDDQSGRLNDADSIGSSLKVVEHDGKESPSYSDKLSSEVVLCEIKGDCSSPVGKQNDILEKEPEVVSDKCPEELKHDVAMKSPSEGVLDLDRSKPKYDHYEKSPESENVVMDASVKQNDDDRELPKQSSVWGNLKSLAGGIIKLWKKY